MSPTTNVASDEKLAQASGIRPLVVTVMIWFVAGVAGGLAGAFYGVGSAVAAAGASVAESEEFVIHLD